MGFQPGALQTCTFTGHAPKWPLRTTWSSSSIRVVLLKSTIAQLTNPFSVELIPSTPLSFKAPVK